KFKNKKIGVFCGSRNTNSKELENNILEIVTLFAKSDFDLVYGGSKRGIMGKVSEIFKNENRQIIGVLPYKKLENEEVSENLFRKIYTENLSDRKQKMIDLADCFLILPGGVGTLDETFEIITSNRMKFTNKKVAIFNCLGFFDHLIHQLEKMIEFGLLNKNIWEEIIIENSPQKLFEKLNAEETSQ
ncbi:MAG: TIGR00730 family Rossman fold protein, partial [Bergeyella zoohelcum]|nr:TIGR00730 family Rossman fold protein [Bergeyella zoohelcum]